MALYVVTGAAGFIGSHLSDRLLAAGHQVRAVDDLSTGRSENLDPRVQLIVGDVADPAVVEEAMEGAEGCFHLAAIASVQRANEEWSATSRTNLGGSVNVFETSRKMGRIPVVYASSAAVYGDLGTGLAHEDRLASPLTAYGADKLASELHGRVAFLVHGIATLGMRFFNVYGPRQDPYSPYSGVISIFSSRIASGQKIVINGLGDQTRDFVHVSDVVSHLCAGMDHLHRAPGAHVLNVCSGRATSIRELAETLGDVVGRDPIVGHGPSRLGDIKHSLGDPALAVSTLGISAGTTLKHGLQSTIACFVS